MMADKKDDDGDDIKNWAPPLSFQFSKPANDNQTPLMHRMIVWGAVVIGLGSIAALLII